MGKTYRKLETSKPRKKKQRKWKKFHLRNMLKGVVHDYENKKEVSELFDKYNEENF